jgi:hypothetical protein
MQCIYTIDVNIWLWATIEQFFILLVFAVIAKIFLSIEFPDALRTYFITYEKIAIIIYKSKGLLTVFYRIINNNCFFLNLILSILQVRNVLLNFLILVV